MGQLDTINNSESVAHDRAISLLLGSIGATAAAMTGAIAAASGRVTIDAPAVSIWPMAAAGAVLALFTMIVAVRKSIVSGMRSISGQSALALSGVAVALLLSFVFVNRVTEALSPTTVETAAFTSASQGNGRPVKSITNSRAALLSCEKEGTGNEMMKVRVSHLRDI